MELEKEYLYCEHCNGTGYILEAKLYPTGHTEITTECLTCKEESILIDISIINNFEVW